MTLALHPLVSRLTWDCPTVSLMVQQEVRFKGNGLESIEVQDNGTGIPTENYATIGKCAGSSTVGFHVHCVTSPEALHV